jgi:hypothetical protein
MFFDEGNIGTETVPERRKEFEFLFTSRSPHTAVVAARGTGKTVAAVQSAVVRLLSGRKNSSALFFSGTPGQAKKTVEPVMRQIIACYPAGFCRYNASDHIYRFFLSESDTREFILLSYEDSETKRGYHPDSIISGECASMPYNMFGLIIEPMLAPAMSAGCGKLTAIGTAQGKNRFWELWMRGKDEKFPDWESYTIKASECNLLDREYLWRLKNSLTAAEYAQEFECDFEANVLVGSVYGEFMRKFTEEHIDDSYDWDSSLPVRTARDPGISDYTAIWFFRVKNDLVTFIDYYEDEGKDIPYYSAQLLRKPYCYNSAIIPHDGGHRNIRGAPVFEQLSKHGFRSAVLARESEQTGINAARTLLKTCRFNKTKCKAGIGHLKNFKYKTDLKTGVKQQHTVHDEHSHGADAFRYAAIGKEIWSKKAYISRTGFQNVNDYNVLW